MTVWHLFAIIWMADGTYLYDNWVYSSAAKCEENRMSLEIDFARDPKSNRGTFISLCEKVKLDTKV